MNIPYKPLEFIEDQLLWINQSKLPEQLIITSTKSWEKVVDAIKRLEIRGAPLIGIAAAYAAVLYFKNKRKKLRCKEFNQSYDQVFQVIGNIRPTAVNLSAAINRIIEAIQNNPMELAANVVQEIAQKIHHDEQLACEKIAENGFNVCYKYHSILTHCNTGPLATGGIGTALGIISKVQDFNRNLHVYVTETAPVGQGARLTVWELLQMNIPTTLLPDTAVGSLLQNQHIQAVVVGADRVTQNGDFANKVGTANIACLCKHYHIPFYVAFPMSSVDLTKTDGKEIPIEFRESSEVTQRWNYQKDVQVNVYNPAFDVTPSEWVSGYITDTGFYLPIEFQDYLKSLKGEVQ
ncbi:MAG: S-methyl-5-thioribose-1-phosphate isomerase [bacterium]|nr:S-methyl-5-thioribose-1-phosphate isomerase [bacterium]